MNYHNAKKQSKATARVFHKFKICDKDFQNLYILREHKRKEHGAQRDSGAQIVDFAHVVGDIDDNSLEEVLETCKHFLLDSEMKNGIHSVYNFDMDTLDPKYLLKKLDVMLDSLKCAAKLNVAIGFLLKNVEDESCRYYIAHENNTLLEKSKLVTTTEDFTKINSLINNTAIIESCTRQRAKKTWKILQADECYIYCSIAHRNSQGLQRHCIARSSIEKSFRQVISGEYPKAVPWQFMSR